jgi:transposase
MKDKRRRHDGAFKARVALEARKEGKTIQEIVKDNDIHPSQVTEWKKMLVENIAGVFEKGKNTGKEDFEKERDRLHSKIGQLTVEVDFLEKNPNSSVCEPLRAGRNKTSPIEH